MNTIISVLTNQFFLLFLTIVSGLLIGKIKIKNFSLGVSGGIFTGIGIGWLVTNFAKNVKEGEAGYNIGKKILTSGTVSSGFFMFFLLLFLTAIGLIVGKNIGSIFKRYGIKFVIIGAIIPAVSMLVTVGCFQLVRGSSINGFQISGMYSGSMTSTPAYGTSLDVVSALDIEKRYERLSESDKSRFLSMISQDGSLTPENTPNLTPEQAGAFKEAAKSAVSLGYTVAFPFGVIVIVIMITLLPKLFGIDIEKEKNAYNKELLESQNHGKVIADQPLDFMLFAAVAVIGIVVGSINIPMGSFGNFSLGAAGGVLISALVFSYIGKIGPFNFRMDTKSLSMVREMGLTFFMSVVGLTYGYDVINSLSGSGLSLALMAIAVETIAVLISFLIGHKVFKLNWVILSGAICGGCTSAPGLGAALSTIGNDEPTAGYGAAQPFAILANVLLITVFHNMIFL
ncbi:MAG: putative permease [Lacrimispora sp.]|jgi:putative transport protein|nr:putative permease [Lacrimispora sp.]